MKREKVKPKIASSSLKKLVAFFSHSFVLGISLVLILSLLNSLIFFVTFYTTIKKHYQKSSPSIMLEKAGSNPERSSAFQQELSKNNIWALYLDQEGKMIWSYHIPEEIPQTFSAGEIALFSKGYLYNYPVFVKNIEGKLLILGYPKNSFFKLTTNYYPMVVIKQIPIFLITLFFIDTFILLGLYKASKKRITKQIKPLIQGIESLAQGKEINLELQEPFLEVGQSLNDASYILSRQNQAKANWIVGISHDIRTPLSLIVGYCEQILEKETVQSISIYAKKVQIQALSIEQLVQDLNLVSKLEYDMQPLEKKPLFLAKVLRTCLVDLFNNFIDEKYEIEIDIPEYTQILVVQGDERLIYRAILNLMNNAMKHNPQGCHINIGLFQEENQVSLFVQDNGIGLTKKTLENLQDRPHYLQSLDERLDLRHGLGLFLIQRIMENHDGFFLLANNQNQKGAIAILTFPLKDEKEKAKS